MEFTLGDEGTIRQTVYLSNEYGIVERGSGIEPLMLYQVIENQKRQLELLTEQNEALREFLENVVPRLQLRPTFRGDGE